MYYDDPTPRNVLLSGFALGALLGASLILIAGPKRLRRARRVLRLRGA